MKRLLLILAILFAARTASAQVVVTPTSTVQFAASADQNTMTFDANGNSVPTLSNYVLTIQPATGGASVFTRDLGKPSPDAANVIKVSIGWTPAQLAAIAPGNYVALVRSVGPGATSDSPLSPPFVVAGPTQAPGPAGQPTVIR